MRIKVLWVVVLALAVAPAAFADVVVTFSSPVTMLSFYSAEPTPLTATAYGNGVTTVTVNSGYGHGAVTSLYGTGVTELDFAGTVNGYVLDDLTYKVGTNTYVINFDDASFSQYNAVGNFYSSMAGGPTFSTYTYILQYPYYNYTGYPYDSSPNVVFEYYYQAPPPPPTTIPEPGTLALFGSGLMSVAGLVRRKILS